MGILSPVEDVTQKEIASLPRLARVAFAARCARRVQPLVLYSAPTLAKKHVDAINHAIGMAERVAAAEDLTAKTLHAAAAAAYVAAAHTAYTAAAAAASAAATSADSAAAYAVAAADAAAYAAPGLGGHWKDATRRAMRLDFEMLYGAATREAWTDATPVPPEWFGPLWHKNPPPGWPVQKAVAPVSATPAATTDRLLIDIELPEFHDPEFLSRHLAGLADAMSRRQIADGGNELEIDDLLPLIRVRRGVPHG